MDHVQHPTVMQKVVGQLLSSSLSRDVQGYDGSFMRHALYQRRFAYGNYSSAAMGYPISLVMVFYPSPLVFLLIECLFPNLIALFAYPVFCFSGVW
ncbi:hypothetical protein GQ457_04G028080 [Hibiscus cannabinus]